MSERFTELKADVQPRDRLAMGGNCIRNRPARDETRTFFIVRKFYDRDVERPLGLADRSDKEDMAVSGIYGKHLGCDAKNRRLGIFPV